MRISHKGYTLAETLVTILIIGVSGYSAYIAKNCR